jgi:anti-sigma factor RsiW
MNCGELKARFDERLDGRLDAEQQREFDAHVAACAGCRRDWQEYAAVWQTLARHEAVEPSFGFVERTIRRLDKPTPTTASLGWWQFPVFRWARLATAAVAIVLASQVGWHHYQKVRQAQVYASAQEANFLGEDLEVIASLDQLEEDNKL